MTPGIWIESTVSERIANLRREAEQGHGGPVRWPGWVGRIRGAGIQLQWRPSWLGPESLTQRGDRS